jgi:glucans biosynthesis protein
MDRRAVLLSAGAWAALEGLAAVAGALPMAEAQGAPPAEAPAEPSFSPDQVKRLAEKLASADFEKPRIEVPEPFGKLSYDQYRDIRFRPEQAIWRGENLDYEVQLFPIGFIYDTPVEIFVVENGKARQLKADGRMFSLGPLIGKGPEAAPFAFSGFRVHGPLNRADYFDEYLVFQGASYLRAVGRGQVYGMSARGLAINTAQPGGEEFPFFRTFWIERPRPGPGQIVIHALLDSPSTTGAYRFEVQPGPTTLIDVDATLYTRRQISHVGIAPLTSMFLYGRANRRVPADFRPEVHDSEGLAMLNGRGERLWRPLTNPKKLQTSAFLDKDPKGFGLSQRDRAFASFQDLEAHYERRPTVWVEPKGQWGEGFIELIEIPVEEEIHDNIAAYWKPAKPLEAGKSYNFGYRMHWTDTVPVAWTGSRVHKTFVSPSRKGNNLMFVVDFEGPAVKDAQQLPMAELSASAGTLSNIVVQRHPEISGIRTAFELATGGAEVVELRLALKAGDQHISESWLYRWTKT